MTLPELSMHPHRGSSQSALTNSEVVGYDTGVCWGEWKEVGAFQNTL